MRAEAPSNGTEDTKAHPDEETTETTETAAQAAKTADETDKTAAAPTEVKSAVEDHIWLKGDVTGLCCL